MFHSKRLACYWKTTTSLSPAGERILHASEFPITLNILPFKEITSNWYNTSHINPIKYVS